MRKLPAIGQALPPRLRRYVLAVTFAGVPVAAAAVVVAARDPLSTHAVMGIASFFALAILAEWRPVPIDVEGKRLVSLAFVFIVSSQLLFGWEWSVVIGSCSIALAMAMDRVEPIKAAFNAATYAIASALAAVPLLVDGGAGSSYGRLAATVVISGSIFVVVNVFLVCVAIALATETPVREVFRDHLQYSGPIFAISVFVAAQAVILWRLSAPLMILLGAPLFALAMYQRSSVRGRVAEEAASTDILTGLRNRRSFEDHAEGALAAARDNEDELALCLVDVDRFKQVNDGHGHMVGDTVLQVLGAAIDEVAPASGFRLGGDEFAVLIPVGRHFEVASAVQAEFAAAQRQVAALGDPVTVSIGIALFPLDADDLHTLRRRADLALYRSKYGGRARVTLYEAAGADLSFLAATTIPEYATRDHRLVTAHRLASLVDALADAAARHRGTLTPTGFANVLDHWAGFNSNHSQAVASLSLILARSLGVGGEDLEQIYVAALLHDVGKIALPDHVLHKPFRLDPEERALVERHSVIGYELLRDIGNVPAATYVLHHHERWDGGGYPTGLAGAEIPFGSRVILVADAFDALTSDRAYRSAVSIEAALREILSQSGRQFDPRVVAALVEHVERPLDETAAEPNAERPLEEVA